MATEAKWAQLVAGADIVFDKCNLRRLRCRETDLPAARCSHEQPLYLLDLAEASAWTACFGVSFRSSRPQDSTGLPAFEVFELLPKAVLLYSTEGRTHAEQCTQGWCVLETERSVEPAAHWFRVSGGPWRACHNSAAVGADAGYCRTHAAHTVQALADRKWPARL